MINNKPNWETILKKVSNLIPVINRIDNVDRLVKIIQIKSQLVSNPDTEYYNKRGYPVRKKYENYIKKYPELIGYGDIEHLHLVDKCGWFGCAEILFDYVKGNEIENKTDIKPNRKRN